MATRTAMGRCIAARRDDLNNLLAELFGTGPGMFSIPLRPQNSQGPATQYAFNAAGMEPAYAEALLAFSEGTLPEVLWAGGVPTETPVPWGTGNLPTQQAAQALLTAQNIGGTVNAGGMGKPKEFWPAFIGGLNLEVVEE